MKNLLLIICCFYAVSSNGQICMFKNDSERVVYQQMEDSFKSEDSFIITDYDRELASVYIMRPRDQGVKADAWLKINRIETRYKDSISAVKQKEWKRKYDSTNEVNNKRISDEYMKSNDGIPDEEARRLSNKEFPWLVQAGNYASLKWYRKINKKYGIGTVKKVVSGKVWLGITDELCDFGLGIPNDKKSNYSKKGKTETWLYEGTSPTCIGDCPYFDYIIVFKNHKAISISRGE